jgi:CheY-like chemotaxis protein
MTKYAVFFDDYPLESENQLFLSELRDQLQNADVEVLEEKTVPRLEVLLRSRLLTAIILDVMAAMPAEPGMEALAGIEVLRRCRTGEYGPLNRDTAIFMRTARGELHVRRMAFHYGCTNYFMAGSEDDKLVLALHEKLK